MEHSFEIKRVSKPDREPDVIIPESQDYFATPLWVAENVFGSIEYDHTIYEDGVELYDDHDDCKPHIYFNNVLEYLKFTADPTNDIGSKKQMIVAQKYLSGLELEKALFGEENE